MWEIALAGAGRMDICKAGHTCRDRRVRNERKWKAQLQNALDGRMSAGLAIAMRVGFGREVQQKTSFRISAKWFATQVCGMMFRKSQTLHLNLNAGTTRKWWWK